MNHRTPFHVDDTDAEFDARLRDAITLAEPSALPSQRFLRRVWLAFAKRVIVALVVIGTLVGGAFWVHHTIKHNYRMRRVLFGQPSSSAAASAPTIPATSDGDAPEFVASEPATVQAATGTPPAPEPAGTPEPSDSLTNAQAVAPLKDIQGDLKACFRAEIKSNPDIPARVVLSFTITEEGKAIDVALDPRELRGRPVGACVQHAVRTLWWPHFSGERKQVSVPFKLDKPKRPAQ